MSHFSFQSCSLVSKYTNLLKKLSQYCVVWSKYGTAIIIYIFVWMLIVVNIINIFYYRLSYFKFEYFNRSGTRVKKIKNSLKAQKPVYTF